LEAWGIVLSRIDQKPESFKISVLHALAAYYRLLEGKNPLYDMTDGFTVAPDAPQKPMPQGPSPQTPVDDESDYTWVWIVLICGTVFVAVCLLLKKRLGKRKTVPQISTIHTQV